MNRITDELTPRDRLATGRGAILQEWLITLTRKFRAQTVLIGKYMDGEENRDTRKMLESLRGTGTLVRNGETLGILTAGHVVQDLKCGANGKVVMAIDQSWGPMERNSQDNRREKVEGWIVSGEGTRKSHEDSQEAQLKDPDIVWIQISAGDAQKLGPYGYANGIFHNWQQSGKTRDEEMRKQGCQDAGLWMCGGWHERSRRSLGKEGTPLIYLIMAKVFRESPVPGLADGWDRFDCTMQPDDRPEEGYSDRGLECRQDVEGVRGEEPTNWEGVSGAGIWRVWHTGGQTDLVANCSLAGVVYAQYSTDSSKPELKLRGHGIGSINKVLGRG